MNPADTARFDQALAGCAEAIGMNSALLREQLQDPRRAFSTARALAGMTDDQMRAQFNCGDELVDLLREYQALISL